MLVVSETRIHGLLTRLSPQGGLTHGGQLLKIKRVLFFVRIPVKLARPLPIAIATTIYIAENRMEPLSSEKQTILVIDDEDSLRMVIGQMLGNAGYRVLTAETGEEALDLYQQEADSICAVVMDLMLPDMYGTQCLQSLLKTNPQAKVIVCSGYAGVGETEAILEKGAKACLAKPITLDQLASAVRRVIEDR